MTSRPPLVTKSHVNMHKRTAFSTKLGDEYDSSPQAKKTRTHADHVMETRHKKYKETRNLLKHAPNAH